MPRNPNGYGSVTKLSGNRSRPWVVKVTVYGADGRGKQKAVAYTKTREEGLIALAQYNNNPWNAERETITLAELYSRWAEYKLPSLGKSLQGSLRAAYRHCEKLYGMKYRSIKAYHMQACIDDCTRGASTKASIKNLWGHLDRFAFENDIVDKTYSILLNSEAAPETSRKPFTREEVDALWKLSGDYWVNVALIYLYTGFRLNELLQMRTDQVDLEKLTFTGGIKTANGKNRIVPIHHRIEPLVRELAGSGNEYLISVDHKPVDVTNFYSCWRKTMDMIHAVHTPHEARHTFETFLDNAGGNRRCIDLLMGHKSKDIGNRVYNHKTIEQLRETIELLN